MQAIDNTQDIIDSRDIIDRIEELTEQFSEIDLEAAREAWNTDRLNNADDELIELFHLQDLAEECEGYADWKYGELLIRDSYFTDYVYDLVRDVGDMPREIPSYIEIDWEATAKNIQQDYS